MKQLVENSIKFSKLRFDFAGDLRNFIVEVGSSNSGNKVIVKDEMYGSVQVSSKVLGMCKCTLCVKT